MMLNNVFKAKQKRCVSCFKTYMEDTYSTVILRELETSKFFYSFTNALILESEKMTNPFFMKISAKEGITLSILKESFFAFSEALRKTFVSQKTYEVFDFFTDDPESIAMQFFIHLNKNDIDKLTSFRGEFSDLENNRINKASLAPTLVHNHAYSHDMDEWMSVIVQKELPNYIEGKGGLWFVNIDQSKSLFRLLSKNNFIASRVSVVDFRNIEHSDGFADRTGRKTSLPLVVVDKKSDNISLFSDYFYHSNEPLVSFGKSVFNIVCKIKKEQGIRVHVDDITDLISFKNIVNIAYSEDKPLNVELKNILTSQDWFNPIFKGNSEDKKTLNFYDFNFEKEDLLYQFYGYSILDCICKCESLSNRVSSYAKHTINFAEGLSNGKIIIAIHEDGSLKEQDFSRFFLESVFRKVNEFSPNGSEKNKLFSHVNIMSGAVCSENILFGLSNLRKNNVSISMLSSSLKELDNQDENRVLKQLGNLLEIFDSSEISIHATNSIDSLRKCEDIDELSMFFSKSITMSFIRNKIKKSKIGDNFGVLYLNKESYLVYNPCSLEDNLFGDCDCCQ